MKLILLSVASAEEKWSTLAQDHYIEKLSHFVKFEKQSLKPAKISRGSSDEKVKIESESILKFLKSDDFIILLDERGKNLDSIQFSKQIENLMNSGKKRCVWIVGGAFGVSDEVKSRAHLKVCLAPFVMNHLLAEVVLLEQLYRGFTILKNIPYHNK